MLIENWEMGMEKNFVKSVETLKKKRPQVSTADSKW